jgi:hypothetical protein
LGFVIGHEARSCREVEQAVVAVQGAMELADPVLISSLSSGRRLRNGYWRGSARTNARGRQLAARSG